MMKILLEKVQKEFLVEFIFLVNMEEESGFSTFEETVSFLRQLGWMSCLVSAGRVTLAGGKTFSHINTLARLPGTTHSMLSVTYFLKFQVFKHKFTLPRQNKLNKAHTDRINERNSNKERDLEISILKSFMIIITRLARTTFPLVSARLSCLSREECLGYRRPIINRALVIPKVRAL